MTYKIDINDRTYRNWYAYTLWHTTDSYRHSYVQFLKETYPDILGISNGRVYNHGMYRTFEFQSEQHYHWFLMKCA